MYLAFYNFQHCQKVEHFYETFKKNLEWYSVEANPQKTASLITPNNS